MSNLKRLSAVYRFGLGCGIFSVDDVIEFADNVIENQNEPPYEIIELAMMSSSKIDDIEDKLMQFYGVVDNESILKIILAIIKRKYNQGEIEIGKAIKSIERLLIQTGFSYKSEYYELFALDDRFSLAENKIFGDLDEVKAVFNELLNAYEGYYEEFVNLGGRTWRE